MPVYSFYNYDDNTYTDVSVFSSSSFRLSLSAALIIPVAAAAVFTEAIAKFVDKLPVVAALIYLLICTVSGFIMYFGQNKHKICGIIAVVLTLVPFGLAQGLWLMPEVAYDCDFGSWFGWLFFTVLIGVGTVFALALLMLFRNGKRHLITVLSLYAIVGIVLLLTCI